MAVFRLETAHDKDTGLYYAELFYPESAMTPFVTTAPRFPSPEAAVDEAIAHFKAVFPGKPVSGKEEKLN